MKRARAMALLAISALVGCGSGMTSGTIRSADFGQWRSNGDIWKCGNSRPPALLLTEKPREPYVVAGTIEVRTSRVKSAEDLRAELLRRAESLDADAVIPPSTPASKVHSSLNPLQRYYVFEDGRTQILEAAAIRFPTDEGGCRRGTRQPR